MRINNSWVLLFLISILPLTAVAQEEVEPVPWAGSLLVVRNATTAISADPSADLTYNPYWEMSLTLAPRWQFNDIFSISASQSFSRELTNSDWTTKEGEIVVSDFGLRAAASRFYTIPAVEIGISTDLALTFPASKASRARTMVMAVGPGLTLSRSFDVLDGLSLSYGFRGTYYWHRYTTGEYESPTITECGSDCEEYLNTGILNPEWRLANSFGASLSFLRMVTLSASYAFFSDPLNDSTDTMTVSLTPLEPTDTRFRHSFDVSVAVSPWDFVSFSLGANTTDSRLRPDSTGNYTPFFNRFTVLYFDVAFDLGAPFSRGSS